MDVQCIADAVVVHLQEVMKANAIASGEIKVNPMKREHTSRHTIESKRLYSSLQDTRSAMNYWYDIMPLLNQYEMIQNVPVQWRIRDDTTEHQGRLRQLAHEAWYISERHSPGFLTTKFPALQFLVTTSVTTNVPSTDPANENLVCDEVERQKTNSVGTAESTAPETHAVLSVPTNMHGTVGTVYQRRAQFRMTISMYQGKPTRMVPSGVVSDVEKQLYQTAKHLVNEDVPEDNRLERYARVTRVHILSLLRGSGGGKYSKWYRESHYIHYLITNQPPPDISHLETTLMIMFGMGWFVKPSCDFFLLKGKERKRDRKKKIKQWTVTSFYWWHINWL